jgi:ketosteroid isomerase-like protein
MHRVVSLIAVSVAVCAACVNSKSSSADSAAVATTRASVESTTAAFHDALRKNDTTSFYSFIDKDVVMMPPGDAPVRGIAAMHSWYSAFLGQYQTSSLSLNDKEVNVGDGWATETGSYAWGLKPTAGGAEVVDHGHYMQIWKRTPEGQWKFFREIWNSAAPST